MEGFLNGIFLLKIFTGKTKDNVNLNNELFCNINLIQSIMKKAIKLFLLVIAVLCPTILQAQTSDEKWVSLGEYIKENYKKKGKYVIPKYKNTPQYVTKLAYKKPASDLLLPPSNIIINKVDHIENHGIPVFCKDGALVVNELFEIYQNDKPAMGYRVADGDTGWEIIDLNGVGSLTSVHVKKNPKNNEVDIFDYIYVTLDETQDPNKIKKEILRNNEEKKLKEEKTRNNYKGSSQIIEYQEIN